MAESMDNSRLELIRDFLVESDQYLQTLNQCLLKAEELIKSNQSVSKDDINLMFRAAHTIKGTASFIDLKTITHLTHEMETILDKIRNDQLTFTAAITDVLFSAFDSLSMLLEKLKTEGNDEGDVHESMEKIKAVLSGQAAAAPVSAPPADSTPPANPPLDDELKGYLAAFIEDSEQNIDRSNQILLCMEKGDFKPEYLAELFRMAHTIKGSSGIVKRKDIETVAHRMEDNLAKLRGATMAPSEAMISVLFSGLDYIKDALERMHAGDLSVRDYSGIVKQLESVAVLKEPEPPLNE
ncbi:MAG: Hpt domain-containing protein, partial [Candidatus Omnitrophica bacterium]|nr:Hpt domain-containing protein [Candidatus Omnitrophota bacterium]